MSDNSWIFAIQWTLIGSAALVAWALAELAWENRHD